MLHPSRPSVVRLRLRAVAFPVAALALAGCLGDEALGKSEEALSRPGPWDIPADVIAVGDTQYVAYTGAGPWVGESGCSGGIEPGAQEFRLWLLEAFPQIASIGGYSCRPIVGDSSSMSVHATGRALDVMIPTVSGGQADNDLGDPIGNWLIEHAEEIGIQFIIWDLWTWNAARAAGTKERMYGGTHPHNDHLHVELSVAAAERMATPWFSGPRELPGSTGCTVPADGGVVEETAECFSAFGPGTYWRRVDSAGSGGSLLWTNAFENATPSNWARWHLDLAEGGTYGVEVYVDGTWGVHGQTRYRVHHAGMDDDVVVDQGAASGWVSLGSFDFDAGGGQHLSVYDNTSGPVPAEQHIAVDAIRLTAGEIDPGPGATLVPVVEAVVPAPIAGGDPSLDDDPYPGGGHLSGGCSAGGSRRGAPIGALVVLVGLALAAMRRRSA